jgi:hypothetical protein
MNKYFIILCMACSFLSGCSSEPNPFTTRYLSSEIVEVSYQGKNYTLNRFAPAPMTTPFTYSFESDGDLNLTLDGKTYEVDSPFDKDKKKKKAKKASKKKSSKKSKKTK